MIPDVFTTFTTSSPNASVLRTSTSWSNDIIKILLPILPEEMIRNILLYCITKIPKHDSRYQLLGKHFCVMNSVSRKHELFYKDGEFLGRLVTFYNGHVLLMKELPNNFISYTYQNMSTSESASVRCWLFLTNKYNTRNTDYYWERWMDDQWKQMK